MSAFIVDKDTIDVIVCAARDQADQRSSPGMMPEELDALGCMLWRENLASVEYRYPDDTDGNRPGPCDFRDADVDEYHFPLMARNPAHIQVIKTIHCYEYQSCEHPGWDTSRAHTVCQSLQDFLVRLLPGYQEAAWA